MSRSGVRLPQEAPRLDTRTGQLCGQMSRATHRLRNMFAYFNRKTREIWITDAKGTVLAGTKAAPNAKIIDEAGGFINSKGFVRTSDYMLVSTGSPLRRARIAPAVSKVDPNGNDSGISASAISRVLNEKFGQSVFGVRHGELPQNRHVVFVFNPDRKMLQAAFSYLRGKGYRLEYTSTGSMLRVVGKATAAHR